MVMYVESLQILYMKCFFCVVVCNHFLECLEIADYVTVTVNENKNYVKQTWNQNLSFSKFWDLNLNWNYISGDIAHFDRVTMYMYCLIYLMLSLTGNVLWSEVAQRLLGALHTTEKISRPQHCNNVDSRENKVSYSFQATYLLCFVWVLWNVDFIFSFHILSLVPPLCCRHIGIVHHHQVSLNLFPIYFALSSFGYLFGRFL